MGEPLSTVIIPALVSMGGKAGSDMLSKTIFGNRFPSGPVNPAGAGTPQFNDPMSFFSNLAYQMQQQEEERKRRETEAKMAKLLKEKEKQEEELRSGMERGDI